MIFFSVLLAQVTSYIVYDHSYSGSYSSCSDGSIQTKDITFSGTFERVPQLGLISAKINFNNTSINGFDVSITTLTKQNLPLNYFAIIQVPHQQLSMLFIGLPMTILNYETTGYTSAFTIFKTYKHDNPNFNKAIASVISYHYKGAFDFDVTIASLNQSYVTVKIRSGNGNLVKVGYYIYLSIDQVFQIQKQITTSVILYTNASYPYASIYALAVLSQGLSWNKLTKQINIQVYYGLDYFQYGTWTANAAQSMTFTAALFLKSINAISTVMDSKVRISQLEPQKELLKEDFPKIQFIANQINQTYSTIPITDQLIFDQTIKNIYLTLIYSCTGQEVLTLTLRMSSSLTKIKQIFCLKQQNIISINFTFKQTTIAAQDLKINIDSKSIFLQQRLLQKVESFYQLFSVLITN